tara:strand:- start:2456 stop:2992 length:537 start_codon:yes stop_codon:yes gene_type:complete
MLNFFKTLVPNRTLQPAQSTHIDKAQKMSLFEAEKIMKVQTVPEVRFYVRWLGYDAKHDTWEPWSNLSIELKQRWNRDGTRRIVQRFSKKWTKIRCNRFSDLLVFFDKRENAMLRFSPITQQATFHCNGQVYLCEVHREGSFFVLTEPGNWPHLLVEFDLKGYYGSRDVGNYLKSSSL